MVKESVRKCSHCGHNGHNSRTCNGKAGGCIKLFGVNIASEKQELSIKKSFSMGNLQSLAENKASVEEDGYLSDGQIHSKRNRATHERKKGKPWTPDEHKIFLAGLQALGRGAWKEISKNFVITRSPTQVASHAQKYFLRQAPSDKKKRRSSLFDMPLKESSPTPQDFPIPTPKDTAKIYSQASSSSSSALQPGNAPGITTQRTTSCQIVNRFPHLCLDERPVMTPMGASVLPTYPGIQYMVAPQTGKIMNYAMSGYLEMPRTLGAIVTCAPVIHPSGIPSSPSSVALAHSMLRAVPETSLPQKDPLELKIAPPQASQNAQASGAIRVI
ncbi:hypothetical protein SLA2020_140360 [Shorea laevis]